MRILFATIGSLGDLHPVFAFALGLKARGHDVAIATSESFRERVVALGFRFHPLRPDLLSQGEHIVAEIMDGMRGSVRLMRQRMFPAVRAMHADLLPLVAGTDLLIASELVFAAPLLAATPGVRWVSFELAPVSLFSMHDPPIMPAPDLTRWMQRGGVLHRLVKPLAKIATHHWWRPVRQLRRELGLPAGAHPLFEGKYSALLNLAMFSPVLQPPQPDWPAPTVQTGFLFHDEDSGTGDSPVNLPLAPDMGGTPTPLSALPPRVREFLAAGEPPIVFTLGSAAVYIAGDFYATSAQAAQALGRRALLLLGKNAPPPNLPPSILGWDYLPYAQILPHAAAVVHQGGVGTTAQTLRAGRPMLVVPFAHDQFDNAARAVRLGVARTMSRSRYRPERVARELAALLGDYHYATVATAMGARVRAERGVDLACTAVEGLLR